MTKLFIVTADDHDYDAMSQWVVGVFTTMELAEAAAKADEESYVRGGGKRWKHNVDITEAVLDERIDPDV